MKHRRLLALLFGIVVLILMSVTAAAAEPEVQSGTCGSLVWEFEDGNLYISGNGPMEDFTYWDVAPWNHLADEVRIVHIGEGITTIGDTAFDQFKVLTTVYLPDSLTQIGDKAFCNCYELGFVFNSRMDQAIPDGVTSIGNDAFSGSNLYELTLGKNVSYIGNGAFGGCSELTHITLSPNLNYVDDYAFFCCINLKGIFFPEQVSYIGEGAFGDCFRMKNIHFTGNAPEIHETAFATYYYVAQQIRATAYYPEDDTSWSADKRTDYGARLSWNPVNSAYIASGAWGDLFWTFEEDGYLTIYGNGPMPECSEIGHTPWGQMKSYAEVVYITEGVTTVCQYAFFDFQQLSALILPDSLTEIGESAFCNCKELSWIYNSELEQKIADGVQTIGDGAFCCCGIRNLTLGDSVTVIGYAAFNGCTELRQIVLSPSLQYIGLYGFSACYQLRSITFPASVTCIDEKAFDDCYRIETLYFEGDAPQIHETAFTAYFGTIEATAYYPEANPTWTADKRVNYGGQLTWIPYGKILRGDLNGDGRVDNLDVEYLLWHTLFPEDYSLNQDGDFDMDESVDNRDVEYLLWHTLFPEDYPL